MKKTLALVGCGSEKQNKSAEARLLYTSTYFMKKRTWAEGCHAWRILSAEHGLVNPDTILEPYDTAMSDLSEGAAQKWGKEVMEALRPELSDFEEVVVLAGSDYYAPIGDALENTEATIHWPFEGKRLFEQMEWMVQNSPPDQTTIGSFD